MPGHERPLQRLCHACLDLIAAWWRVDRIRISPHDGELLRLRPGCLFTVLGLPAQVRTRRVIQTDDGNGVQYECATESGPARLDVRPNESPNGMSVQWSVSGRSDALDVDSIEIWASNPLF
jgi:hypothetical protein